MYHPPHFQSAISSREPASHFVRLHNSIRGIVTFFHGDDKDKIEADERLMRIARYIPNNLIDFA